MVRCDFSRLFFLACMSWMTFFWGCAGRTYLIVDYQVPTVSQELNGQVVRLQIEDQRTIKTTMSKTAAAQFKSFKDHYSLAWIMPDKQRILSGEHHLHEIFNTAIEKRLNLMGAKITEGNDSSAPLLAIALETFTIDLKGRKWIVGIGYRASLTKEGHPTIKEHIRGNAERTRIIGRKGADMVTSEIFTDVVNRLNITKMFKKAGLIP